VSKILLDFQSHQLAKQIHWIPILLLQTQMMVAQELLHQKFLESIQMVLALHRKMTAPNQTRSWMVLLIQKTCQLERIQMGQKLMNQNLAMLVQHRILNQVSVQHQIEVLKFQERCQTLVPGLESNQTSALPRESIQTSELELGPA
jgi:hypothetical protein